jgi:hypothetical protein
VHPGHDAHLAHNVHPGHDAHLAHHTHLGLAGSRPVEGSGKCNVQLNMGTPVHLKMGTAHPMRPLRPLEGVEGWKGGSDLIDPHGSLFVDRIQETHIVTLAPSVTPDASKKRLCAAWGGTRRLIAPFSQNNCRDEVRIVDAGQST